MSISTVVYAIFGMMLPWWLNQYIGTRDWNLARWIAYYLYCLMLFLVVQILSEAFLRSLLK